MNQSRYLWLWGIVIEMLLLCGWLRLSPLVNTIRWIDILTTAALVHFCIILRTLKQYSPENLKIIIFFAILFRVSILPIEPTLSDDVYRNIWDGRVQVFGLNPYRYSPDEKEVVHIKDDRIWKKINHPEYRTIYPPSAQLFSWAAGLIYIKLNLPPLIVWKLLMFMVEIAGGWLLLCGLIKHKKESAFIIYAWSPLLVVEFYVSGHIDGFGVGLLAGALGCYLLGNYFLTGIMFIAGTLVKLVSFPLMVLFPVMKGRKKILLGVLLTAFCLIIPYRNSGRYAFESLGKYSGNWEFNGTLHRLLRVDAWASIPRKIAGGEWGTLFQPGTVKEKRTGRMVLSGIVLLAGLIISFKGGKFAATSLWTLAIFLMLQHTIHPWYLTWILPLLALKPVKSLYIWIALTPLTYQVLFTQQTSGVWKENYYLQSSIIFIVIVSIIVEISINTMKIRNKKLSP